MWNEYAKHGRRVPQVSRLNVKVLIISSKAMRTYIYALGLQVKTTFSQNVAVIGGDSAQGHQIGTAYQHQCLSNYFSVTMKQRK